MSQTTDCLIQQTHCGRVAGNPICPKCGIRADVRYVSQDDMDMAVTKGTALYWQNHAQALDAQINKAPESPPPNPTPLVAPVLSRAVGQVFQDLPIAPQMVVLPSGSFLMGSESTGWAEKVNGLSETPKHKVTIAYKLAMGRYPITCEEWDACVADGGVSGKSKDKGGKLPVSGVSWDDAQAYSGWLNAKLDLSATDPARYRLPSESEWEYACRAGSQTKWCFGDDVDLLKQYGWYSGLISGTHPVGQKRANEFGLYDMHGNVWEWVQDCKKSDYDGAPSDGSAWEKNGYFNYRVMRGGAWDLRATFARSASRSRFPPDFRVGNIGFRLARTLP